MHSDETASRHGYGGGWEKQSVDNGKRPGNYEQQDGKARSEDSSTIRSSRWDDRQPQPSKSYEPESSSKSHKRLRAWTPSDDEGTQSQSRKFDDNHGRRRQNRRDPERIDNHDSSYYGADRRSEDYRRNSHRDGRPRDPSDTPDEANSRTERRSGLQEGDTRKSHRDQGDSRAHQSSDTFEYLPSRRRGNEDHYVARNHREEDRSTTRASRSEYSESRGRSTTRQHSESRSRSVSSSGSSEEERGDGPSKRRRRRRDGGSRSRSPSRRHRHRQRSSSRDRDRKKRRHKEKKKEKGKEERRSVLTGKKIKLKVKRDRHDHERDANREDLLNFLNSTFE